MKNLIENYINNMTENDIKKFLQKNNYEVNNNDINTILYYIKKYWKQIMDGDISIFEEIKPKISKDSYKIMINLYNQYKIFL